MIDRLEVSPGPGTVIRFGHIAAWAGEAASPDLIRFLSESARNLAGSDTGGDLVADHLAALLAARDPEPHVPFVVVGPGADGWVGLLHGSVQVWDGSRWTGADPDRGWRRAALAARPALAVATPGGAAPRMSPDSLWHLESGIVPGGGFVLVPTSIAAAPEQTVLLPPVDPGPPTEVLSKGEPATTEPRDAPPRPAPTAAPATSPAPAPAGTSPPGVIDMRPGGRRSVSPHPPLPPGGAPARPTPGAPVVAGTPCSHGHLNRPGLADCVRCGMPLGGGNGRQITGPRPALGCLITDRGAVYALDGGYLVGSRPAADPTVRGRLARPLHLDGDEVAGAHAEIRLHDWDVIVTDRASEGGTHVFAPEGGAWQRLRPYEPHVLAPGSHLAFGQRVATYISPWVPWASGGTGEDAGGQETWSRY